MSAPHLLVLLLSFSLPLLSAGCGGSSGTATESVTKLTGTHADIRITAAVPKSQPDHLAAQYGGTPLQIDLASGREVTSPILQDIGLKVSVEEFSATSVAVKMSGSQAVLDAPIPSLRDEAGKAHAGRTTRFILPGTYHWKTDRDESAPFPDGLRLQLVCRRNATSDRIPFEIGNLDLEAAGGLRLESPGTHGGMFAFAYSPDGSLIAGATGTLRDGRTKEILGGGEVVLWDAKTGRRFAVLGTHRLQPTFEPRQLVTTNSIVFSGDGRRLISASRWGGTIVVWDIASRSKLWEQTLPASLHAGNFQRPAVAINHDGTIVATVTEEFVPIGKSKFGFGGTLTCWNVENSEALWSLNESRVRSLAIRADGRLVGLVERVAEVVETGDGNFGWKSVFEVTARDSSDGLNEKTWSAQPKLRDHPQWLSIISNPVPEPPSRVALLGNYGMTVHDIESGTLLHRLNWQSDRESFTHHLFSSDGKSLARQGVMGKWIERMDVATGKVTGLQEREFQDGYFRNTAFAPDLSQFMSVIRAGMILRFPESD